MTSADVRSFLPFEMGILLDQSISTCRTRTLCRKCICAVSCKSKVVDRGGPAAGVARASADQYFISVLLPIPVSPLLSLLPLYSRIIRSLSRLIIHSPECCYYLSIAVPINTIGFLPFGLFHMRMQPEQRLAGLVRPWIIRQGRASLLVCLRNDIVFAYILHDVF